MTILLWKHIICLYVSFENTDNSQLNRIVLRFYNVLMDILNYFFTV